MNKRWLGRTRAFSSLAVALLRVPLWLACATEKRRHHEQAFFATIVRGFGISISQHGRPSIEAPTLFIMNHISWADIPVMLAILDADFVAKAEMLDWPVIGRLARRFNPVFVAREKRHGSAAQVETIRARLLSGRSVILCPEGTTSDGTTIQPFRTSLFAAVDAAQVIQPLVLNYLAPDGTTLSAKRQREVAWIDDDDLVTGAARLARASLLARVEFLPAVEASGDRKKLAKDLRQVMLAAYAAAPKRPE